jgi:glycosyltransferase involved in cell wall biosynthesis
VKKILLVTNDVIGDTCAGPGIRYIELGKELVQKGYEVTLLGKSPSFANPQPFHYSSLTLGNLITFSKTSDCLIIRGGDPFVTLLVLLFAQNKDIVADLYTFTHFEVPHVIARSFREKYILELRKVFHVSKLKLYCKCFNKFWVANERQKYFLYGVLYTMKSSPEQKDIAVIPFGYPSTKPIKQKSMLRGVIEGINKDDFILIWGGGVWDWLDPITLIKAMSRISKIDTKIKLYFMALKAPSGYLPEKGKELIRFAQEKNLINQNVFINDLWVPYNERLDFLLESDVGITLHPRSLETVFSFRTRNLDYIYCGLPMIHSQGDVWADFIKTHNIGLIVSPDNDMELSQTILNLAENRQLLSEMKNNISSIFTEFTWENIAEKAASSIEEKTVHRTNYLLNIAAIIGNYSFFALKAFYIFFRTLFK